MQIVVAAVAYYLAGLLGLQLAIPPGFASAVWPAAGVALALVILYTPWQAIAGVGIASFLLNLGVSTDWYRNLDWAHAVSPAGIACGAMLQAWLGARLFRAQLGPQLLLESIQQIVRFALIVALGGCLLAPTFGVASLFSQGYVAQENLGFTWWTWWVGDSLGVLLFTPLLLMLLVHDSRLSWARKLQMALPTLAIFCAVLVLFFSSVNFRSDRIQREIRDQASEYIQRVQARLLGSEQRLQAYSAFYYGSSNITFSDFMGFCEEILRDDDVLYGVGWTEIVPADKRQQVVDSMLAQGIADFQFTQLAADGSLEPAGERPEYYPVIYIYPLESNYRALGLDLGHNPSRLQALTAARLTGKAVATEPIMLAQEDKNKLAFILYIPVYVRNYDPALLDPVYSRETLRGFVSGIFRVSGILGGVIEAAKANRMGIAITDITNPADQRTLVVSDISPMALINSQVDIIEFGGRQFRVAVSADRTYYFAGKDWLSWLLLICGLLMASILQVFILTVFGTTEKIRHQVAEKTAELQTAVKLAEQANEAKSNFLANMSHELRTPMNAILGFIRLCQKTELSSRQAFFLDKANMASETLLALINQTLDYAKIEAGHLQIDKLRFTFLKTLKKIHTLFYLQAEEKGIYFRLELLTPLPAEVIGDDLRLEQVLINLCANAVKFTEAGEVIVRVACQTSTDGKVLLDIEVVDTGIGIEPEHIAHLFEAFQQADGSTTRRFGGTGLGLTITRELVELMGGSIRVDSRPGEGSCFHLQLPLQMAEGAASDNPSWITQADLMAALNPLQELASEPAQEPEPEPLLPTSQPAPALASASDPLLQGMTILLVEDIALNRMVAQDMLESHGAIVIEAVNGEDALLQLARHPVIDLVLMDIQMPVMDGFEATRRIRQQERYKTLPVLAMTANVMASDVAECLAAGMNAHIGKPLEEEQLLQRIRQSLGVAAGSVI